MRPDYLRLGQVLMLLALLQVSGGHWLALQSVAWTEMLVSYTQTTTITEAVAQTFDGQHPCSLCKKIEQGKIGEGKGSVAVGKVKVIFVLPPGNPWLPRHGAGWPQLAAIGAGELRSEQPAVPPPRSA